MHLFSAENAETVIEFLTTCVSVNRTKHKHQTGGMLQLGKKGKKYTYRK